MNDLSKYADIFQNIIPLAFRAPNDRTLCPFYPVHINEKRNKQCMHHEDIPSNPILNNLDYPLALDAASDTASELSSASIFLYSSIVILSLSTFLSFTSQISSAT